MPISFQRFLALLDETTRTGTSEAELRAVYEQALEQRRETLRAERRARRRRMAPWDPAIAGPWRPLADCRDAAMQRFPQLTMGDFETVLGRGRVWITGIRDDVLGDMLPDRIEALVTAARKRVFNENSILAVYDDPPDRTALFGVSSRLTTRRSSYDVLIITFHEARAHWPQLVAALEEAGFAATGQAPESANERRSEPRPPRPTTPRQLAAWVFRRHKPEARNTFAQRYREARADRALVEITTQKMLEAYHAVYQTASHPPPKTGWPLQPEYQKRWEKKQRK
jgi:hypothetical protein